MKNKFNKTIRNQKIYNFQFDSGLIFFSQKWGKMSRTYMSSDFTIDDAPLQALEFLMVFKLCHYITGDPRWQS